MCGRTACTLDPDQTRRACTYTNRQGRRVRPRWHNPNSSSSSSNQGKQQGTQPGKKQSQESQSRKRKYYPSFNLTPTAVTPVLLSAKHFDSEAASDDRQLTPMQWGLVPSWHKGDPMSLGYKMNNCRREGMMQKPSFSRPAEKGQRCVVLVDGYYEWLTSKDGKKQPYFIYFPQDTPIENLASKAPKSEPEPEPEQPDCLPEEEVTPGSEWKCHRLITMAGLFDRWYPPKGGEPLYTYTVITVAASATMSWLHHRMPAILDGDEAVKAWLDYGTVPTNKALELINAEACLASHPVSTQVNNSRYKGTDCIIPIDPQKPMKETASSKLMSSWLIKSAKSSQDKTTTVKKEVKEESISPSKQESSPQILRSSPQKLRSSPQKLRSSPQKLRSSPRRKTGITAWLSKANQEMKHKVETEQDGPPPKKTKLY